MSETVIAGVACRVWAPAAPRATLLLLHGFGGDSLTFAGLAPLLTARGWRVIAPDMPAHGATAAAADTPDDLLPPLVTLLDSLDGKVALAGHSLGGAVATRLAVAAPSRIAHLTLLAPGGLGPVADPAFLRGVAAIATGAELAALLALVALRPPAIPPDQLDTLAALLGPRGRLTRLAESLSASGLDITADLARLRVPARALFGLEDRVLAWTQARVVPPRIAVHLLPDAGHALHWDQPALVAELIG